MNEYGSMANCIYSYLNASDDPDECLRRLDCVLNFVIRLRHSYVDNDKPMSSQEVNMDIVHQAELVGLKVKYVELE